VSPPVVVAGNWKMHHGPAATRDFFRRLGEILPDGASQVLVFPPALSLAAAREARPAAVHLGVQNVHWERSGAFTGELSAAMAREAGASHVLAGHSERRQLFGETDAQVASKARMIREEGLIPVVCVGETLAERRAGQLEPVLLRQLDAVLDLLDGSTGPLLLAYEPVWAIGTGETATPADASHAHGILRRRLGERLGPEGASISILYGGSVKPGNAEELMRAPGVDGVLVGGASLDPEGFAAIVGAAPGRAAST
jgi:triosephosphate isomerase (TIM)